ncbi:MAG TPA: hemolysin III family protein [Sediminispirochaeta sp.]|nr:hemolysin III family protein [Sediminispirochaeta sp.]
MNEPKKLDHTAPLSKDGSVHVTDEVINTISHMAGALFAVFGTVLLVAQSAAEGKVWHIVSFSIYGFGLISLFTASTLHHGLNIGRRSDALLRLFDYLAIYLLIAGTYTPLCLVVQRNLWGWSLFAVVWALSILGIVLKSTFPSLPRWVSHTFYISIGWIGAVLIVRSIPLIGTTGFLMILGGGVLYTFGAMIYYFEKPNPLPGRFGFHELWHFFVLAAAGLHYFFMYLIVLPME